MGNFRVKMANFRTQNCPKIASRWPQDGPKIASWRVLEPLGGQDGPKMEPRGFQGRKVNSFPPCWGPSWDPIFDILTTRVVHKRLEDPVGLHVVSRHKVLDETWCPRGPMGHKKHSKTVCISIDSPLWSSRAAQQRPTAVPERK